MKELEEIIEGNLLNRLLYATSEHDLTRILVENAERYIWLNADSLPESGNITAIAALASLFDDAYAIRKQQYLDNLDLEEKQSFFITKNIRKAIVPQSDTWTSFAAMDEVAKNLLLTADGERFATNLTLFTSWDLFETSSMQTNLPVVGNYCGKKGYYLRAQLKNQKWHWTLIKRDPETNNINYLAQKNQQLLSSEFSEVLEIGQSYKSIQKLYAYQLPVGSRSVISKDILENLQEFLFEPIHPFSVSDTDQRYAYDRNNSKVSFGQQFKLRLTQKKYLAEIINERIVTRTLGELDLTIYLFKEEIGNQHKQITKHVIKKAFFRNRMYSIFLRSGIVRHSLDASFTTEILKLSNLKDHLLLVVDCDSLQVKKSSSPKALTRSELAEIIEAMKEKIATNKILEEENQKRGYLTKD